MAGYLFLFLFSSNTRSLHHYLERFFILQSSQTYLLLRIPGTVLDVGVGGVDKQEKSLLWCLTFYSGGRKKKTTDK